MPLKKLFIILIIILPFLFVTGAVLSYLQISDLNNDNNVDANDFAILLKNWGSNLCPSADINQDGMVDARDFGIMMSGWGRNSATICGNDVCEEGETAENCPEDCGKAQYFGYLGTAIGDLGAGNYINILGDSSNIATIAPVSANPENVGDVIAKVQQAASKGMKSFIWVDHLFFDIDWDTSEKHLELYPDYQQRWNNYSASISPYIGNIYTFYIMDEPYQNGYQAGISESDMKKMLEKVTLAIKSKFPDVNVGSIFAHTSISGSFKIPESYDLAGFDYYYSSQPAPRNIEQFFNDYNNYLLNFKKAMYPHQRLILIPGAFYYENSPVSESELKLVADFYYNLAKTDTLVDAVIAFLYPSVPGALVGLEDLNQIMTKYKEIGAEIINGQ